MGDRKNARNTHILLEATLRKRKGKTKGNSKAEGNSKTAAHN